MNLALHNVIKPHGHLSRLCHDVWASVSTGCAIVDVPPLETVVPCRLQQRNTMLQAMVDSPEEAEGWDAPRAGRPAGAGGTMTSSSLHRILQVTVNLLVGIKTL